MLFKHIFEAYVQQWIDDNADDTHIWLQLMKIIPWGALYRSNRSQTRFFNAVFTVSILEILLKFLCIFQLDTLS